MATRPTVRVILPIGPQQQASRELELAKWLAGGKHIQGSIFFTSRDMKFSYINIDGDTEVSLREQVPDLISHDRDLGLKRNKTHSISFVKANPPTYARLFVRVLSGCQDLQINATCQYLNGKLDWQVKTFPGHMETYEKLVPICRDILHPEFRYYTRHNRTKPYMWNPLVLPESGSIPTLGDMIHNGSHATSVDMESPTKYGQWPEVTLVRRSDSGTIHHISEMGASGPADEFHPESDQPAVDKSSPSVPQLDGGHAGNLSGDSDLHEGEANKNGVKAIEPVLVAPAPVSDAEARTEGQAEAGTKTGEPCGGGVEEELPPYSESDDDDEEVDSEAIKTVPVEDSDEVNSELGGEEVINANDYDLGNMTGISQSSKAANDAKDAKSTANANDDSSTSEDHTEEILSGNLQVPGVKQVTVEDDRPVTLRRLHQALPRSKTAIPNGAKQKVAFSMLVINIRQLELEYNKSRQFDGDLEDLDEGKLLNQRQVKREMKHLLELMAQRDKWESNHRIRQAKAVVDTRKKKSTKIGRKKEADKFVHVQRQRLMENAELEKSSSLDLDVERGPREPGLAGFGMYRRQQSQMQEYKRKNKRYKKMRRELSRNESTTSSSGSVKPLHKVLEKQSQAVKGASLRALANEEIFKDINESRVSTGEQSGSKKSKKSKKSTAAASTTMDGGLGGETSFAIPTVPRGYVKADTLTLMKEVYKQQAALMTTTNQKFDSMKSQVQNIGTEQRKYSRILGKNSSSIKKLQSAFFDYDMQTHQELCDVENEFLKLLPVDELGPRTDFIFTDPACAKTIAKRVINNLNKEGHSSPTLTQLVNETARLCFSTHLRAHLHIVKRQWKDNVGWYKIKCPVSYQTMMEKYVLTRLGGDSNFGRGWKAVLYQHFKNFGETYMSVRCKKAKTQRDFVIARRLERISLQRRHFDAEREDRELVIPTVEEEMDSYGKHSEYFEDGNDLNQSQDEKSQKAKKNLPDEDKTYEPLPCLELLNEMAKRLKDALAACVKGQEAKKREVVNNEQLSKSKASKPSSSSSSSSSSSTSSSSSGSSSSSTSDSEDEMAKNKERRKVTPLKIVIGKKRKKPETLSGSSESPSDNESESSVDEETFRKRLSAENTSSQTLVQAEPTSSAAIAAPKGKPKAFAEFMARAQKKNKKKSGNVHAKKRKA